MTHNKTLASLALLAAIAASPAFAASYEQGVCDGIRATEAHPPTAGGMGHM